MSHVFGWNEFPLYDSFVCVCVFECVSTNGSTLPLVVVCAFVESIFFFVIKRAGGVGSVSRHACAAAAAGKDCLKSRACHSCDVLIDTHTWVQVGWVGVKINGEEKTPNHQHDVL